MKLYKLENIKGLEDLKGYSIDKEGQEDVLEVKEKQLIVIYGSQYKKVQRLSLRTSANKNKSSIGVGLKLMEWVKIP